MLSYADAMSDALDRLSGIGFEHGSGLINHAPMAAEALATLGYADDLVSWVQRNLSIRRYEPRPEPRWALSGDDEAEWRPALGDLSRAGDWAALFERERTFQRQPGCHAAGIDSGQAHGDKHCSQSDAKGND